jgi:beta-N-acetylhexosaminidase
VVNGPAIDDAVLGHLLPAFEGADVPAWLLRRVAEGQTHGVTVFLRANAGDVDALAAFTERLHAVVPEGLPLLIGADQEGGQLVGLGHGTTRFPGAMALGAADDPHLTEAVARATAVESRALGITVCYAPVCDLAISPANISLGTRAFGSDPASVGRHVAAFTRGLEGAGVAATLKHFPGFGEVGVDPHDALGVVEADRETLDARELRPFRAAIDAGAGMTMSGHVAVPSVTGDRTLPATLSRRVMDDLLRRELGFDGVSITDAMDMGAVAQGSGQLVDSIVALRAGIDLLLLTPQRGAQRRLEDGLRQAARRGLISARRTGSSRRRVMALRRRLRRFEWPDRSALRSSAHEGLALDAARRSITLVRDEAGLLPLRPTVDASVLVVTPEPRDLTPADSSQTEPFDLAGAVGRHHPNVRSLRVPSDPRPGDVSALRLAAEVADIVIVGTLATSIQTGQAALVRAVLGTGAPTIAIGFRTPYDLVDYPDAGTYLCAWSIVPASVEAAVEVIFGAVPVEGRLPVAIPGLYPRGHGKVVTIWD